jgi:hypothetical protein
VRLARVRGGGGVGVEPEGDRDDDVDRHEEETLDCGTKGTVSFDRKSTSKVSSRGANEEK